MGKTFQIIALLFLCAFTQTPGLAQQFTVAGNMDIVAYANGQVQMHMTREFKCIFSGCQFEISSRFDDTTNSMTYVYDGQDLYRMFLAASENKAAMLKAGDKGLIADGVIDIGGSMPIRGDGSYNQIIWLAYGSQCYFRSLSEHMAKPVWTLDDPQLETNGFTVPVIYHTNADHLGLPAEVYYLSDGIYRGYDWNTKTVIRRPCPPPFDKGFTNATYRVLMQTNLSGASIPTEFEFIRYAHPHTDKLVPRMVIHGVITNVTSQFLATAFNPPGIIGILNVHDYRHPGDIRLNASSNANCSFLNYFITNGNWPENGIRKK